MDYAVEIWGGFKGVVEGAGLGDVFDDAEVEFVF